MLGSLELKNSSLTPFDIARFWTHVTIPKGAGCWVWNGGRQGEEGYGTFRLGVGSTQLSHRLVYAIFNERTPADTSVCHSCDFPPCCNPEHLFLGTNLDNVADSVAKGRRARKLSDDAVTQIRTRASEGHLQHRIANDFGISQSRVSQIVRGQATASWDNPRAGADNAKGEDQHLAKLTESQVLVIRERYARGGITQRALATEFHVRQPTIERVVNRKTWAHI